MDRGEEVVREASHQVAILRNSVRCPNIRSIALQSRRWYGKQKFFESLLILGGMSASRYSIAPNLTGTAA